MWQREHFKDLVDDAAHFLFFLLSVPVILFLAFSITISRLNRYLLGLLLSFNEDTGKGTRET